MSSNVHQRADAAATRKRILDAMPGYPDQIADRAGVSKSSVYAHLKPLHAERFCYIKKWKATTGLQSPYWARVEIKDAPRPPQDRKAYNKKHYEKTRAPMEKEKRAVRRAARENAASKAKNQQTWASALLGMAA